jgi:hypothetical protein
LGGREFEANSREFVGEDVQLFHTSKLIKRNDLVFMASDMLPGHLKWKGLDDRGDADDHIVFGAKSITRKGKRESVDGLSETLEETLIVSGDTNHWSSSRMSGVFMDCWLKDGRIEEVKECFDEDEKGELTEAL